MISEGPLTHAFETLRQGVIKQRLITYFVRDGVFIEETVERDFTDDGDYIDSVTTSPLATIKDLT